MASYYGRSPNQPIAGGDSHLNDKHAGALVSKGLEGCRCLNLCELQLILADQMKLNIGRNQLATSLIKKSYDYACKFAQITNRQAIFDLRSILENRGCLEEFEMAALVNLMPRTAEEAKIIIPSLNRLSDDTVTEILNDIEKFKVLAL